MHVVREGDGLSQPGDAHRPIIVGRDAGGLSHEPRRRYVGVRMGVSGQGTEGRVTERATRAGSTPDDSARFCLSLYLNFN